MMSLMQNIDVTIREIDSEIYEIENLFSKPGGGYALRSIHEPALMLNCMFLLAVIKKGE